MWSTIQPPQAPLFLPVDGHGFARWNAARATALRLLAVGVGGGERCLAIEGFLAWTLGDVPEDADVRADKENGVQAKTNKLATARERVILKLPGEGVSTHFTNPHRLPRDRRAQIILRVSPLRGLQF